MPVQLPIGIPELFAAIKQRWADRNLATTITGGIWAVGDPPESTRRPYVVIPDPSSRPTHFTNKSQIDTIEFALDLVADNLDLAGPLVSSIKSALASSPLALTTQNNAYLLRIFPGPERYFAEKQYVRVTIEFSALLGQDPVRPS